MTAGSSLHTSSAAAVASRRGGFLSRLVFAAIGIALFAGLVWADGTALGGAAPAWWLFPAAAVVGVASVDEMTRLFASRGIQLPAVILRPAVVAVAVAAAVGNQAFAAAHAASSPAATMGWSAMTALVAVLVLCAREVARYGRSAGAIERLTASVFVVVALGLPLACMMSLRLLCVENLGPEQTGPGHLGLVPLVSVIAAAKVGDIAAYVVGSLVGRHRLAPRLSPGKTWEGAAASLAGAVVASWVVIEKFGNHGSPRPWGGWLVFGLFVGAAAMLGDLAESLLKRECAAKDSGRSLGGLGGFLDLIDSLLFAAPVAWVLWVTGG